MMLGYATRPLVMLCILAKWSLWRVTSPWEAKWFLCVGVEIPPDSVGRMRWVLPYHWGTPCGRRGRTMLRTSGALTVTRPQCWSRDNQVQTKNKLVDPQNSVEGDGASPELSALGAEFPARAEFPPLDTGVSAPPWVKINISIFKMRLNRMLMIKTLKWRQDEDKNCGLVQVASDSHCMKPKLVSWRNVLFAWREELQRGCSDQVCIQTTSSTKSSEEESTPKLVGQYYANLSMVEPQEVYAALEYPDWGVTLHEGLSNKSLRCLCWMCGFSSVALIKQLKEDPFEDPFNWCSQLVWSILVFKVMLKHFKLQDSSSARAPMATTCHIFTSTL